MAADALYGTLCRCMAPCCGCTTRPRRMRSALVRLRVKLGFRQNGFRLAVLAHDDVAIAAEVDVRQVAEGAGAQVCQEVRAHLRPADKLGTGRSDPTSREGRRILGDSQVAREAVELTSVTRVVLDGPRVVSAGVAADDIRKVMT